jgi:SAM-dependent methyltransferase
MPAGEVDGLHSASTFGATRDFWWNQDHLALVAERLGLAGVGSILEVGSGVGHWGQLLLESVVGPQATLIGVEREPAWVVEATARAAGARLGDRVRYVQGVAQSLPFGDASFDLVTCQTLLMHVPDPGAVLGEMLRVLRPGGVILAAEPNSRASLLVDTDPDASVEDLVDLLQFYLICERGKLALGEGDSSVGDLLPRYLADQGAVEIQTFIADKTTQMTPPYASEEQQAVATALLGGADRWIWSRGETERFFIAGGGAPGDFDAGWDRRIAERRVVADRVRANAFHGAGATIHYVVAARRPATPTST